MAKFTEEDRTFIREFLGFGAIFLQADPRLENAITAIQAEADGGDRPDNTSQLRVYGLIYGQAATTSQSGYPIPATTGLLTVKAQFDLLMASQGATSADGGDVKLDVFREDIRLRQQGRMLCTKLATVLGLSGVRMDVFSSAPVILGDDPFVTSDSPHW